MDTKCVNLRVVGGIWLQENSKFPMFVGAPLGSDHVVHLIY